MDRTGLGTSFLSELKAWATPSAPDPHRTVHCGVCLQDSQPKLGGVPENLGGRGCSVHSSLTLHVVSDGGRLVTRRCSAGGHKSTLPLALIWPRGTCKGTIYTLPPDLYTHSELSFQRGRLRAPTRIQAFLLPRAQEGPAAVLSAASSPVFGGVQARGQACEPQPCK